MTELNWQDFEKIDLRAGTVISAEEFPEAKNPAYILKIDFGELGILKSSAQITGVYSLDDLIDKQIIAVVNFPKKQIGPIMSECLVLGIYKNDLDVVLIQTERKVPNGAKVR